jgi:hypothetical protein
MLFLLVRMLKLIGFKGSLHESNQVGRPRFQLYLTPDQTRLFADGSARVNDSSSLSRAFVSYALALVSGVRGRT